MSVASIARGRPLPLLAAAAPRTNAGDPHPLFIIGVEKKGESMPRNQTKRVTIRLTPEEYHTLMWKRIEAAGVTWRDFIFKMCTEGKIVSNDALRELNKELHYQGNNLNQLTRLAHQGEIRVVDLSELRKLYEKLLEEIKKAGED